MIKKISYLLISAALIAAILLGIKGGQKKIIETAKVKVALPTTASPSAVLKPTASETDIAKNYGPCIKVPVLMYHHIQSDNEAKIKGQGGLSVSPDNFRKQLQYLKEQGYNSLTPGEFSDTLESGEQPQKSVLITLDDGYEDNYTTMFPILKEFGFKATIFTATGLVENPDYLKWSQIEEMKASGLVYFGNHTWSHQGSNNNNVVQRREIGTADIQLAEKGLNGRKMFAYPYGKSSTVDKNVLTELGYKIAFTTRSGKLMCRGQSQELPRIRVGNRDLKSYGL